MFSWINKKIISKLSYLQVVTLSLSMTQFYHMLYALMIIMISCLMTCQSTGSSASRGLHFTILNMSCANSSESDKPVQSYRFCLLSRLVDSIQDFLTCDGRLHCTGQAGCSHIISRIFSHRLAYLHSHVCK